MVAAQALYCDDSARAQVGKRHGQRLFPVRRRGRVAGTPVRELRPAIGARDRLRMEAAISRVAVLGLARRAQRELAHRRPGPVIRQVVDDRGSRPAVGAICERVAIAPICRVEQLGEAVVARGDVWREEPFGGGDRFALFDREAGPGFDLAVRLADFHRFDSSSRRRITGQPAREILDCPNRPCGLDHDLTGAIDDGAVQPELGRKPPHERPEADALDNAADFDGARHTAGPRGRPRRQSFVAHPIEPP